MGEKEKKPVLHTSDISSLLDLKTEFLERKKAAEGAAKTYSEKYVNPTKSNVLAMTKEEKKMKEQTGKERHERIQLSAEAIRKEEAERQKRQQILEQKAKVYDRMVAGESLTYDDGTSVEFLVNFARKKKELEERGVIIEPPPVEDPRDVEAASQVFLRARDEEETPLIVHYDPSGEPGRMFGAAHIPLPINDEEQRQKTIDELKRMTEETAKNRKKRKQRELDPKAQADRERLNKLRVEKGLPPLESSDSESDSDDDEGREEGGIDVNSIPLPPGMVGPSTSSAEGQQKRGAGGEEKQKNEFKPVREWDRGKFGYKHWIEGQREVRNEEFAPPSFYYSDTGNTKKRRKKQ